MIIETEWGWSVTVTDEQYQAGFAELRKPGVTHWRVWRAFVDAGVPVRAGTEFPASQAATALMAAAAGPVT